MPVRSFPPPITAHFEFPQTIDAFHVTLFSKALPPVSISSSYATPQAKETTSFPSGTHSATEWKEREKEK